MTSDPGVVADSANPDVVLVGGGIMSATLAALFGVVVFSIFAALDRAVVGRLFGSTTR